MSIAAILRLAGYTSFKLFAVNREGIFLGIEEHLEGSEEPTSSLPDSGELSAQSLSAIFGQLKQQWCKELARLWIKEVEPYKRQLFPYSDGELSRPPWWPIGIPHKEPDHLRKAQRVRLLTAIVLNKAFSLSELQAASEHLERKMGSAVMNRVFQRASELRQFPITPPRPTKFYGSSRASSRTGSLHYPTPQSPSHHYGPRELPPPLSIQLFGSDDNECSPP